MTLNVLSVCGLDLTTVQARGVDVTAEFYPYSAGMTRLDSEVRFCSSTAICKASMDLPTGLPTALRLKLPKKSYWGH